MKIQLKQIKSKNIILIILLAIGLILLAIPANKPEKATSETDTDISVYIAEMENKISALILQMDGINEVSVMITMENRGEQILAENKSNSLSEFVIISGQNGDEGLKLTETFPEVRGVAIVCTNGNDSKVKEKVTSLVSSALGISSNRITVVG